MIRPATVADLPELTEIEREADTLFPEGRILADGDTYSSEALLRVIEVGQVLVIENAPTSTELIGFSVAQPRDDMFHLDLIAVRPSHGRRGHGRQLLEAVIVEARRRQRKGITLTTFSDLAWNAPFYAKHGFRILAEDETNDRLRSVLEQEAAVGMDRRVAMFRPVSPKR